MEVGEIMSKAIIVDDKISVRDAAKIMSDKNIGSLIVVNSGMIKGIITERDVLKNLDKINNKITNVMTRKVLTIDVKSKVNEAVKIMKDNRIKRLPVLRGEKLIGLVSMTDIIAYTSEVDEEDFIIN